VKKEKAQLTDIGVLYPKVLYVQVEKWVNLIRPPDTWYSVAVKIYSPQTTDFLLIYLLLDYYWT
jgi:hypothetical protein